MTFKEKSEGFRASLQALDSEAVVTRFTERLGTLYSTPYSKVIPVFPTQDEVATIFFDDNIPLRKAGGEYHGLVGRSANVWINPQPEIAAVRQTAFSFDKATAQTKDNSGAEGFGG